MARALGLKDQSLDKLNAWQLGELLFEADQAMAAEDVKAFMTLPLATMISNALRLRVQYYKEYRKAKQEFKDQSFVFDVGLPSSSGTALSTAACDAVQAASGTPFPPKKAPSKALPETPAKATSLTPAPDDIVLEPLYISPDDELAYLKKHKYQAELLNEIKKVDERNRARLRAAAKEACDPEEEAVSSQSSASWEEAIQM